MKRMMGWMGKLFEIFLFLTLTPVVLIVGLLVWLGMKGLDHMYEEEDYD